MLNASLISSTWADFIGESQICMSKVNLVINGRKYFLSHREPELKRELQSLITTKRRYRHLVLYAQKPGFLARDIVKLISSRKGKWKSIKIWSERFEDQSQFEDFLLSTADSIEDLELRSIKTFQSAELCNVIEFKKLKKLSLCNNTSIECPLNTICCLETLESLEIENSNEESLPKFLSAHSSLKELTLIQDKCSTGFYHKLASVAYLRLERLKLKMRTKSPIDQTGLIQFIQSQNQTLKRLTIDANYEKELLTSIFELSHLKSLTLAATPNYDSVDLPTNQSIVELDLNFGCNQKLFLSLINALPRLETLSVPQDISMTKEWLERNCTQLKQLKVY